MFKSTQGLFSAESGATRSWLAGVTSVALLVGTMALPAMADDPTPEPTVASQSAEETPEATPEATAEETAEETQAPETDAASPPATEEPAAEESASPEATSEEPAPPATDAASPSDEASPASEKPSDTESSPAAEEPPAQPAPDTPSAGTPDGSDSTDNAPPVLEQKVKGLTAISGPQSISVYFPDFGYEKNYTVQVQQKDGTWETVDAELGTAKVIEYAEGSFTPPAGTDHVAVVDGLKAGKAYDLRVVTAPTAAIAEAATEDAQPAGTAGKGAAAQLRPLVDGVPGNPGGNGALVGAGGVGGSGGNAVSSQEVTGTAGDPTVTPLAVTNPELDIVCGLDVAVIVDRSGSISTAGATTTVRNAVGRLMDGFVGTGSHVSLISFSVNATLDHQQQITTQTDANSFDPAIAGWTFTGRTNWDAALGVARNIAGDFRPQLVVFITDGLPNLYINNSNGSVVNPPDYGAVYPDFSATALAEAVEQSDAIKGAGQRILGLAVGNVANNPTLQGFLSMVALTGPQYWNGTQTDLNQVDFVPVNSFDVLEDALVRMVNSICVDFQKATTTPTPVQVGGAAPVYIDYSLTIRSNYPAGAGNLTDPVTDHLPAGVAYVPGSAQVSLNGGASTAAEPGVTTVDGRQLLTWSAAGAVTLSPGQYRTFTYRVQVTTTQNNQTLTNDAEWRNLQRDVTHTTQRVGANLTIAKTVNATKHTEYLWEIAKDVDRTTVDVAPGGEATFNYTVTATPNGSQDGDWDVSGTITVTNPNPFAVVATSITDTLTGGGTCTVTNGTNQSVPANSSINRTYTCTGEGANTSANTATVAWDAAAAGTPAGSANTGALPVTFTATSSANQTISVVDDKTDPANPVDLGTATWNAAGTPTEFTYSLDLPAVDGACTTYTNTAWLATDTQGLGEPVEQDVEVCAGLDLTISKTVTASKESERHWQIEKVAEETRILRPDVEGRPAVAVYTVRAIPDGSTDSDWAVGGTITVTNPNQFAVTAASITDTLTGGGTCTVTDGTNRSIPAGGSINVTYTCTGVGAATSANTATVTWDAAQAHTQNSSASTVPAVAVVFPDDPAPTNQTVEVWDDQTDPANPVLVGQATWNADGTPVEFNYQLELDGEPGTCTTYTNTAWLATDESGTPPINDAEGNPVETTEDVEVCVGVDLTVEKTATGTFDREYDWSIQKLVNGEDDRSYQLAPDNTFAYTVNVIQTGVTDSGWVVTGAITVSNPNDWQAITLTDLTDEVGVPGGVCTVDAETLVVPAASGGTPGQLSVGYLCTFEQQPERYTDLTNTATATWDDAAAATPSGSAQGTSEAFDLEQVSATNQHLLVSDRYTPPGGQETVVELGEVHGLDVSPFTEATFTYDREYTPPTEPLECSEIPNVASLQTPASEGGQGTVVAEDDATAVLCSGRLIKDADPTPGSGVEAGDTITYEITVANPTSREITGQTLIDTLPVDVTLDQASVNPAGTYDAAARTITWTFTLPPGTVAAPGTVTFTYKVTVNAEWGDAPVLVNTAEWVERKLKTVTEHPVLAIDADFSAFCVADAPYYSLNVFTQNHQLFASQTVTVDWYQANDQAQPIDANGNPTTDPAQFVRSVNPITGQPVTQTYTLDANGEVHTGNVIWPGAAVDANGRATAWPGWVLNPDGTWTQVDDGGVRERAVVVVTVNPTIGGIAAYPPAASGCANPPANPPTTPPPAEGEPPPPPEEIAKTGAVVSPILLTALLTILGGGLMITWGQRRRRG